MAAMDGEQHLDYTKAKKGPQFAAALAASICAFILGNWMGWESPVQPQLQDVEHKGNPNNFWYVCLSDDEMSWIGSLILLGALCGSMVGGFIMDRWGRKTAFVIASLPLTLAWFLVTVAVDSSMILIGCFVSGFFGGIGSVVTPTYIGEVSTPEMRGTLGNLFQMSLSIGMVYSSVMGLKLNWRMIAAVSEIFPLVLLLSAFYIPESPVFLLKKGRRAEAFAALHQLRGSEFNVGLELNQLELSLKTDMVTAWQWSDLVKPWVYKPIATAGGVMIFVGLSGINVASFYSVDIFQAAGSSINGIVCAIILNITQLVVNIPAAILIERMGRRMLFLTSQLICCLAMAALGAYFFIEEGNPAAAKSLAWLPLVSLIVFSAGFAYGIGPVPWVICGELIPRKVKGLGVSVATFCNYFSCFLVAKTFIYVERDLGKGGAFCLYSGFCMAGVLFSTFLLPETKGKSAEEIQAFFSSPSSLSAACSPTKQTRANNHC